MTAILEGLDPDFRHRYALAVTAIRAELGVSVSIVSAFRSRAHQQRLYDGWIRRLPGYNLAAPPGHSNHERGLAIDIAPNSTPAMRDVFARFGLHFPVSGEPWHVEPRSARGLSMPPLTPIPAPVPVVPPEDDDVKYLHYKIVKQHVSEPSDWLVPTTTGQKFPCGSTGYLTKLTEAKLIEAVVDLTGDKDASAVFRNAHP